MLDYEMEGTARVRLAHRTLPQATLNELHALLARLPTKGKLTLDDYPPILSVVAKLLNPVSSRRPDSASAKTATLERVRDLLQNPSTLAKLARHAGYHPDHLNRKLKREAGFGLREFRDRLRLERAQAALRAELTIAGAATAAGFDDPNYFARWFRRQTGRTPSTWRR